MMMMMLMIIMMILVTITTVKMKLWTMMMIIGDAFENYIADGGTGNGKRG